MTRRGIACAGNWIIDHTKLIDHYPPENSVADILGEARGSGGCAYNVIINLARFDPELPLTALGVIGDDADGDDVIRECSEHGNIRLDQLRRTPASRTSYTDVYSSRSGGRTFFHDRGANRLFAPDKVDFGTLDVAMLHLGYLTLLDGMDAEDPSHGRASARFLAEASAHGIRTSVDLVSSDRPDFLDLVVPALAWTDRLIINDFEAGRLSGMSLIDPKPDLSRLREAGGRIFEYGVRELVVIHFPAGCYARSVDGTECVKASLAIPPEKIAGTTGAGDSFCAGVLYGLHQRWDLPTALEFGTCAGAMNLLDVTTTGAMGKVEEVWKMRNEFGFREGPV